MKAKWILNGVLSLVFIIALSSCEKNGTKDGTGTLRLSITDAPFPIELIDSANVVITKVEVRDASDNSENPFTVLMEDTVKFNLLELRNGITAEMLETDLPVGEYDLIRLYVESASVSVIDGGNFNLKVPSGSQTGIKLFIEPSLRIEGGLTSDLLLDFSLDKSFVLQGKLESPVAIKGFNFKPVIRITNNSTAGSLQGTVSEVSGTGIPNAEVWIESDSVVSKAFSDSTGYYAMLGIPAGTYDFFSWKEDYDTLVVNDIVIVEGNKKVLNAELSMHVE